MKLSRRQWAASIATAAASATLPQPAEAQAPPANNAELDAARASLQASIQQLRALDLPIATEPATHFTVKL